MTTPILSILLPDEYLSRLAKLKALLEEAGEQGDSQETHSQPQAEKLGVSQKEIPPQDKKDRTKGRELFHETKLCLESTFPKTFNFKEPKPLKLGIHRDLLLVSSPYSKSQLRKCLRVYVNSKAYLEALVQENWRYDLNGERVEEITQEQKDHALKQLEYNKVFGKK